MSRGIIATTEAIALQLAYQIEMAQPDRQFVQDMGDGMHETRPEYRIIYRNTRIQFNQLLGQWATVLTNPLVNHPGAVTLSELLGWIL